MKWKCLKCGEEVSIWATVCPHCWRNPGGLLDHLMNEIFKWAFVFTIITLIGSFIIGVLFGKDNSVSQPAKQPTKKQEQVTTKPAIPTIPKADYKEDSTFDSEVQHTNTTSSTSSIEYKTTPVASATTKSQETKVSTPAPVQKTMPKPIPKPLPKPEMDVNKAMDMFNE